MSEDRLWPGEAEDEEARGCEKSGMLYSRTDRSVRPKDTRSIK